MIKKMRYQFIFVTMVCISFIFILILSVINISMTISSRNQGYGLLYSIADAPADRNELKNRADYGIKESPRNKPVRGFDAFRCFSVLYDNDNKLKEVIYNESSDLTKEEIIELAGKVMENPQQRGILSKYLYIIKEEANGIQLFFLDYSFEKNISLRLFWTCLYIGLIGIFFIFILVIILSRWIVGPVQIAFEKQKQFIADASHELKTPITIITTNAEVLASEIGESKWLGHITAQTKRMNTLVKNLLELTKLDSYNHTLDFIRFNLSTTVLNTALSFESIAYEYGKKFEINISDDIYLIGNENSIKQLTTILLDNAFKYSGELGKVNIQLMVSGDKKILTVENTGNGIPKRTIKNL